MSQNALLAAGEPAPWFRQRTGASERFNIDTIGGRYVVLCFLGTASDEHSQAALAAVAALPAFFDDTVGSFFAVSCDPADETERRVTEHYPGYRVFWDFDLLASRLYGVVGDADTIAPTWFVLGPTLRILRVIPFQPDRSDLDVLASTLAALPPPGRYAGFELQAPILVLPNVFERDVCEDLIGRYERHGGFESGFMREVGGKTVGIHDRSHKSRKDYLVEEPELLSALQQRFSRRVVPEIRRAHQFAVTRMERYLVGCYAAEEGGHFRAHRDNTTKGTAHRRFAVSVNLNAEFDGGEVSFPEYGARGFKAPIGGAVVFSCSLLHAVSQVTRGRRYAFLPFLYDDAAARIREQNLAFLEGPAPIDGPAPAPGA
jgi:peroxiredoxin